MLKAMQAHRFKQAVHSYDQSSIIQQRAAEKLWQLWPTHNSPDTLLDFGCGTGRLAHQLARQYPQTQVVGLDAEAQMVQYAQDHYISPNLTFHQSDRLDDRPKVDWVISNMCLQWVLSPEDRTLSWINQALKMARKGIGFSMVVQPTGDELVNCLKECCPKYLPIPAQSFWVHKNLEHQILTHWPKAKMEAMHYRQPFASTKELLAHMKATGVHARTPKGHVWTPHYLDRMDALFQEHYGRVTMTYRVLFCWIENAC